MTTPSTSATAARERSYSWADPQVFAEPASQLSGIDFLTRIGAGTLPPPPAAATTGIVPREVGDGVAVFELEPAEWHYNPIGSVHGGILSTLADTALGCAVHSRLPAGTGYTSLDLVMKFTRAATLDSGLLTCTGRVVSIGSRVATAEAEIVDARGRTVAHGLSTCLIFDARAR